MVLTNRELANAIWLGVGLAAAACAKPVRASLGELFNAATHPRLVLAVLALADYSLACALVLKKVGFWHRDMWKDSVLWFVCAGIFLAFSGVVRPKDSIWSRTLRGQLKAVVILEYLAASYTFSLLVELILTPLLAILGGFSASREKRNARIGTIGLSVAGFAVLTNAFHQVLVSSSVFDWSSAARSVLLGPVLSVMLVPCVFVFDLWGAYENLFTKLRVMSGRDSRFVRHAKLRLFRALGPRPNVVRAFTSRHAFGLVDATTADIEELLSSSTVD